MTDKPSTLTLSANEWRALIQSNLTHAAQFVNSGESIPAAQLKGFHEHMDRIKYMAAAWHLSAPAQPQEQPNAQTADVPADAVKANGAVPRRRGGWPRGKPRKAAEAVQ